MTPIRNPWIALAGFVGVCFLAAAIGGFFTNLSVQSWYPTLRKPSWTPPSWLFGPVWTTLYVMMGVAAWLVWREKGFSGAAWPLRLFFIQLALNAAWSVIFFGMRSLGWAVVEIALLWGFILLTALSFWLVRPAAGLLMVPYFVWVSYAAVLNYSIWKLNS